MSVAGGRAEIISAKADIQTTPDSRACPSVSASLSWRSPFLANKRSSDHVYFTPGIPPGPDVGCTPGEGLKLTRKRLRVWLIDFLGTERVSLRGQEDYVAVLGRTRMSVVSSREASEMGNAG